MGRAKHATKNLRRPTQAFQRVQHTFINTITTSWKYIIIQGFNVLDKAIHVSDKALHIKCTG